MATTMVIARPSAVRSSRRTSNVDTPMRIEPNSLSLDEQRLAHFVALIGVENRPQACERPGRDQFLEVGLLLDRRALARRKRVGHGDAVTDRRSPRS